MRDEESVRQFWVVQLLEKGFPHHLISLEGRCSTCSAPLSGPSEEFVMRASTLRRYDILCYGIPPWGGVVPLLLLECKREGRSSSHEVERSLSQVEGYRTRLGVPFWGIVIGRRIALMRGNDSVPLEHLPAYHQCLQAAYP